MLLTAIIFMSVSIIIVFGLSTPIIKQMFLSRDIWGAKQSYYLSEAGTEDVLYRLKDATMSSKLGTSETLSLNGYEVVTQITTDGNEKIVTTLSDQNDYKKSIEAKVTQGTGVSFNYGIQAGNGGFVITGGSFVDGNVYSNGDIFGGSGVHVYGSAIAASGGSVFEDETNESPATPPSSITFNNAGASRDFAQSFQPSTTSALQKISLYIKKTNYPADFVVSLMTNSSGNPGSVIATSVLSADKVTTNFGWVDFVFNKDVKLNKDTTYWFVITGNVGRNKTSLDKYTVGANNLYTRGIAKTGLDGTWSSTNLDAYFSIYFSSVSGKIFGNEGNYFYIGATSTDIAWAGDVSHVGSVGNIYCLSGTNNVNGKACDTSRGVPGPMPMPISQPNIDQWKSEAETGGTYNGNYAVDWDGDILGSRKITGNLTVNGGGTLMVTGTIWIQGNLIVTGGGKIKIAPSMGAKSAVLVVDGYASIDGGAQFEGSGVAGSYPIVVSTSKCPDSTSCAANNSAVHLSGGAGAVVLNAPYGKVDIVGGSGVRSASGNMIYIDGGGKVTYDAGLVSPSFSSGPSGGWNISSWKELEN